MILKIFTCYLQDTKTLATLVLHHRGYTAKVQVAGFDELDSVLLGDLELKDQPDGGANALNPHRFFQHHI